MVEHQLPKLDRRVRFPLPAYRYEKCGNGNRTARPRSIATRKRPGGSFESKPGLKGGNSRRWDSRCLLIVMKSVETGIEQRDRGA